jgi:putative transposase
MKVISGIYKTVHRRLQSWDYGWDAPYFVTICTKNRYHYFGAVIKGKVHLTEIGKIADECWLDIPNHAKNVELGAHVIMPNHVHGIISLIGNKKREWRTNEESSPGSKRCRNQGKNTLSSIIGSYKSAVSKHAHRSGYEFEWQSRYYDSIIRDKKSLERVTRYIINNPRKWEMDILNGGSR